MLKETVQTPLVANDQRNRDAAKDTPCEEPTSAAPVHAIVSHAGRIVSLQRLNKDGTIHSEHICESDYGLFSQTSLKQRKADAVGTYQAILGDAYEAGFDINCHPEDLQIHMSQSDKSQIVP